MSHLDHHRLLRTLVSQGVALILSLILLGSCGVVRASSGSLRGTTVLELIFPVQTDGRTEVISVNADRMAGRAFVPTTVRSDVNSMQLSETVWTGLEQLHQRWCTQAPAYAVRTPRSTDFEVVFQCGRINNPAYYVAPSALPPELRALVEAIPSTDERRIFP